MELVLWIIGVYLVAGAAVAYATYEPEQGGWLWSVLIWPIIIYECYAK